MKLVIQKEVNVVLEVRECNVDKNKIVLYNVNDIREIFKCGRRQAYELMNSDTFPSFRINTKLLVSKIELEKWIGATKGKTVEI